MAALFSPLHHHQPAPYPPSDMNGPHHRQEDGYPDAPDTRPGAAGLLSYFGLGPTDKPHPPPPPPPPPYEQPNPSSLAQSQGQQQHDYSAMTLLPTNFRPMTTQPSKCSKLKVRIYFDSTIFQAGGTIFGRMEVTATSSRSLRLGEIAVELAAYEEIASRECTATQSFLSSRLCFQGPGIPPSNAVYGSSDENGFFMARKGKTTFPFAFQLPLDCPSSLIFGATASLRYVVTGLVQIFYHGKEEMVAKSKEAFVVEAWDGYNAEHRMPVRANNSTKLFWGGTGSLELEAVLPESLHSAGGNLSLEVRVRNSTSRKVQGIRLGVARQLVMVADKAKAEQNPHLKIDTTSVSELVGSQEFKTSTYLFDPGEERIMTLNMAIPINARTIRGTALFEVTCSVVVSMLLGAFSGELSVELPVKICHPASLTPAPKPTFLSNLYNLADDAEADVASDAGRSPLQKAARRVGSNSSNFRPISPQRGRERDDSVGRVGSDGGDFSMQHYPQGDHEDDRQLSPANSITSIRSILSKSSKLTKLADRIGRSTSPSAVSQLGIENDPRKRAAQKSTPLGPAQPIAYVPAVERVRYTPFQAPPTAKAKEFLKAANEYQSQFGLSGVLEGLEDKEIDLADGAMATAIHDWLARKEAETAGAELQRGRSRLKKRGGITANRQLRQEDEPQQGDRDDGIRRTSPRPIPISTSPPPASSGQRQLGSPVDDSPRDGLWSGQASPGSVGSFAFTRPTRRGPAAPQTEAFGSAPEDSIVNPPLFHRPLPCPLPPSSPNTSPTKLSGPSVATPSGLSNQHSSTSTCSSTQPQPQPRARSQSPVAIQTPENLLLAREAFERVKRMGSPVREQTMPTPLNEDQDRTPARSSPLSGEPVTGPGVGSFSEEGAETLPRATVPRAPAAIITQDFIDPDILAEQLDLEQEARIKVPVPFLPGVQQSALSKLLSSDATETHPTPQGTSSTVAPLPANFVEPAIVPPERTCRTPELSHVPMNRPLPAPKPKPRHEQEIHPPVTAASLPPPQVQKNIQQQHSTPVPAPRTSRMSHPQPLYPAPPAPQPHPHVQNGSSVATAQQHQYQQHQHHHHPSMAGSLPKPVPRRPAGLAMVPAPQVLHQRALSPPRVPAAAPTLPKIPPPLPRRVPAPIVVSTAPTTTTTGKRPPVVTAQKPVMPPPPVTRPGPTTLTTAKFKHGSSNSSGATSSSSSTSTAKASSSSSSSTSQSSSSQSSSSQTFVYPKATRKPVTAPKPPGMTAKPKKPAAATSSSSSTTNTTTTAAAASNAAAPRAPGPIPSSVPARTDAAPVVGGVTRGPQATVEPTTAATATRSRSPMRDHHSENPQPNATTVAGHGQQHGNPNDATTGGTQDPYGFRALPIAMANSIRVQGTMADPSVGPGGAPPPPPVGGGPSSSSSPLPPSSSSPGQPRYAVNTTVLRQAIGAPPRQAHPPMSSGGGGGSMADLFQGAKNVASAAAANLGWRQDLVPDNKIPTLPEEQVIVARDRPEMVQPLPRGAHADRTLQHDLTMKDIDFETVREQQHPSALLPSSVPAASSSPLSSSFPRASYPMPPPFFEAPPPPPPLTASPSSGRRGSTHSRQGSLGADINLDKTLPKIHENAASRFDMQVERTAPAASTAVGRSASPNSAMARNGLRVGGGGDGGYPPPPVMAFGGGGGGGGPKPINPRLQEYIQKYNLAANAT